MSETVWTVKAVAVGVVVLACGFAVVGADQGRGADPSLGPMSELTSEVRLLRQAVEKAAQTQAQVQAMAVYLSAQQNRLNQTASRTDALHRELATITDKRAQLSQQIGELQEALAGALRDENDRKAIEGGVASRKRELAQAFAAENEFRSRVAGADAHLQADLAQWTEMITRLEQLTRQ